jgi:hypothetical protein
MAAWLRVRALAIGLPTAARANVEEHDLGPQAFDRLERGIGAIGGFRFVPIILEQHRQRIRRINIVINDEHTALRLRT